MLCTFLRGVSWEPAEATTSGEWSQGPAMISHHLLSTGDSREQVPSTQLIWGLPITGPNLGCFLGGRGTWPLMCEHICLPHSWPWTMESSSWRPVQRPTSMWRT